MHKDDNTLFLLGMRSLSDMMTKCVRFCVILAALF
jgi:hypothetical protein